MSALLPSPRLIRKLGRTRSGRRAALLSGLLLCAMMAAACGARTSGPFDRPDEDDDGSAEMPKQSDDTTQSAGDGDATQPSDDGLSDDQPGQDPSASGGLAIDHFQLEACQVGLKEGSGPCPWYAEGYCYPTKEEACNCICPRDRDSVCLSGFPGTRVEVMCN